jgi:hypothetical protein
MKRIACLITLILFSCSFVIAQEPKPVEPELIGVFYYLTPKTNSLAQLERQTAKVKQSGLVHVTVYGEIKGEKSPLRIKQGDKLFLLAKLATDPSKFKLYTAQIKKGNRQLVVAKVSEFGGATSGADVIAFEVTKSGDSYKFFVPRDLPPGEYMINADDSNDVFCFGIDPK